MSAFELATGTPEDFYRSTHLIRYVDYVNGLDANDGLTPYQAKKTIQAAYDDVPDGNPATGVEVTAQVVLLAGDHNVGTGFLVDCFKPVILQSLPSTTGWGWAFPATSLAGEVRIYSSSSIGALVKIQAAPSGSHNNYGSVFRGLWFDLGSGTSYGVHGINANKVLIEGCHAIGPTTPSIAQYLARSEVNATYGDDASWWRFFRNSTYHVGLHKAGNWGASPLENCNQHVWAFNQLLSGALIESSINIYGGTRCSSFANNLEGSVAVPGITLEATRQCAFIADGGESTNTMIRAVGTSNNNCNLFAPLGITTGQAGKKLVDDDNPKRNRNLTDFVDWQVYQHRLPVTASKTTTYAVNVWDQLVRCDSTAGGFTVTLPTAANSYGETHTIRNYGSANNVTVASGGGTIDATTVAFGTGRTWMSDGTNWWSLA